MRRVILYYFQQVICKNTVNMAFTTGMSSWTHFTTWNAKCVGSMLWRVPSVWRKTHQRGKYFSAEYPGPTSNCFLFILRILTKDSLADFLVFKNSVPGPHKFCFSLICCSDNGLYCKLNTCWCRRDTIMKLDALDFNLWHQYWPTGWTNFVSHPSNCTMIKTLS